MATNAIEKVIGDKWQIKELPDASDAECVIALPIEKMGRTIEIAVEVRNGIVAVFQERTDYISLAAYNSGSRGDSKLTIYKNGSFTPKGTALLDRVSRLEVERALTVLRLEYGIPT
ncbi:MAG: hypothetical protein ACM3QZ_02505 [Solirubrobacterales bacterium]